jgi:hypothetical protein
MPRAGCSLLRDATDALRSSLAGEMVESEVVDNRPEGIELLIIISDQISWCQ